jgi:hypothetical protein
VLAPVAITVLWVFVLTTSWSSEIIPTHGLCILGVLVVTRQWGWKAGLISALLTAVLGQEFIVPRHPWMASHPLRELVSYVLMAIAVGLIAWPRAAGSKGKFATTETKQDGAAAMCVGEKDWPNYLDGLIGWPRETNSKVQARDTWLDDRMLDKWLGTGSNAEQIVATETKQDPSAGPICAPTTNSFNNDRVSVSNPMMDLGEEAMQDDWNFSETGHWPTDCQRGTALAKQCASRLAHQPHLLNLIMRNMINRGHYGGVEAGFCGALAEIIAEECA